MILNNVRCKVRNCIFLPFICKETHLTTENLMEPLTFLYRADFQGTSMEPKRSLLQIGLQVAILNIISRVDDVNTKDRS